MANTLDTHLSTKVRLSEVRQRTDSEDNPGTRALQQSAQDNQLIQVLQQLHDHMTNLSQSREKEPNSQVILSPALETDMKFVWKVTKYTPDETVRQHIADIVCQSGFLEVCDKFWMICHWKTMWLFDVDNYHVFRVLKLCLLIMWSISDISSEFCQSLCDSGFVNTFQLTLASHFKSERPFLNNDRVASYAKCLLGILHNVARLREDSHPVMRQNLKLFKLFSQSDHLMVKTKATMILSYLVKESETNMIVSNLETISFMALLLRNAIESPFHFSTKFGISALEVLNGLNNLAANDENKVKIIDAGCLPLYAGMLQPDCTDKEQLLAAKGLWLISFCEERREEFFKCDCTEALKRLEKSENEALCHASRGALWELQNKAPIGPTDTNFSINTEMSANVPHVMISYQWDSKPIMLRLKDRLKQSGYKVWMDVEHMSGSTLEAMALAVERAAVVIVAMSQKYKDSPSCRTEAEYTYKLRKAVLPLQVEDGYIADGWLGMLVGTRLYISVHGVDCVDITLPKIVSELGCRGKPEVPRRVRGLGQKSHSVDLPFTGMAQKTNVNMTCLQSDWRRWTDDQVTDWLISTGIENRSNFPVLDGSLLQELQRMWERAPSCFYTTLKTDLQLSLKESLQMTKALSTLS